MLVQFRSYLRPGACDALRVSQLIAPTKAAGTGFQTWGLLLNPIEDKIPGKTGIFDSAVMLDTEMWMDPFYHMLTAHRNPHDLLWPIPTTTIIEKFNLAIQGLGLKELQPCRYSLRHGGASDDLLTGRRDLLSIKMRGQWRSDASLRRYAKQTRALNELRKMPKPVVQYGKLVSDRLEAVFHGLRLAPPMAKANPKKRKSPGP